MVEAPLQARKLTTPGCCGVNLGHSHSCQVVKWHRDSTHRTSSEDCPGQMQSQDSSDLAELKEYHFPRKKTQTTTTTTKAIPLSRPANPIGSARTGPTRARAEGSGKAAHYPEQQEKLPPFCKGWAPAAWGQAAADAGTHSHSSGLGGPKS